MIPRCVTRVSWCLAAMVLVLLCTADNAAAQPEIINQTSCFASCTPPGVAFLTDVLVDCQAAAPDNSISRALARIPDRNGPNRIRLTGTCQQVIAIAGFNRLVIEGDGGVPATITRGWNVTNSQLIAFRSLTFDLANAFGQNLNLTGADVTLDGVTVKNAQSNHGIILNASRLGFGAGLTGGIGPSLITANQCSGIYVGAGSHANVAHVTISSNGQSGCGHLGKHGVVAEKGGSVNLQNFVTANGTRQDAALDITANFEDGILMESGTTINSNAEGGGALIHVFNNGGFGVEANNASGDLIGHIKLDGNAPNGVPDLGIATPIQLVAGGAGWINIGGGAEVLGGLGAFGGGSVVVGNGGGMTITGGLLLFYGSKAIDAGGNSIDAVTCDPLSWLIRFDDSSTIGTNTCPIDGPSGVKGDQGDTGAQGIQGPPGVSGREVVSASEAVSLLRFGQESVAATCPAGKAVLGGGSTSSNPNLIAVSSLPTATGEWTVVFRNPTNVVQAGTVTATAICATTP